MIIVSPRFILKVQVSQTAWYLAPASFQRGSVFRIAVVWLVNFQSAGIVFLSPLSELRFYRGSLQLSIPDKHEEKTLSPALNNYTKLVANPFST